MEYATPELVLLGTATALVQGVKGGEDDNPSSITSRPALGLALGLDE